MEQTANGPGPVSGGERIDVLDIIRGVAVLGILVMNIQSFAMIGAAYLNPVAFGDLTGINKFSWIFSHLFFDQKMMTLFGLLFGAGMVLFAERLEAKGLNATGYHYRRIFILLGFGLIHAYLIWHGDILVTYAVAAAITFLFRKKRIRTLVIIGILFLIIPSLIYFFFGLSIPYWPAEAVAENLKTWLPSPDFYAKELSQLRSGFISQMEFRVPEAIKMQTFVWFIWNGWRSMSLMLLGMALYKSGVITGKRTNSFYYKWLALTMIPGLLLTGNGILQNFAHGWSMEYSFFLGWQWNYWGSMLVGLGYVGLLCLVFKWLGERPNILNSAGRMAFSNYILTSIIAGLIFYGHGLGLVGQVERWHQLVITVLIWAVLLGFTALWSKRFRMGPLEWLWRVMTYGKGMRIKKM